MQKRAKASKSVEKRAKASGVKLDSSYICKTITNYNTMKPKKNQIVTIRLTEDDFLNIQCDANDKGMTISEYIRYKSVPKFIMI